MGDRPRPPSPLSKSRFCQATQDKVLLRTRRQYPGSDQTFSPSNAVQTALLDGRAMFRFVRPSALARRVNSYSSVRTTLAARTYNATYSDSQRLRSSAGAALCTATFTLLDGRKRALGTRTMRATRSNAASHVIPCVISNLPMRPSRKRASTASFILSDCLSVQTGSVDAMACSSHFFRPPIKGGRFIHAKVSQGLPRS